MYQYKRKSDAATRIQAMCRSKRDRAIAHSLWVEHRRIMASILISAVWRGRRARVRSKGMKRTKWLKKSMLLRLQCWFRIILSRKVLYSYKKSRWLVVSVYAATVIQSIFRGRNGRKLALQKAYERQAMIDRQQSSCIKIQSFGRMFKAKQLSNAKKIELINHQNLMDELSNKIQLCWRIFMSKKVMDYKYRLLQSRKKKEHVASYSISVAYRRYSFRQSISRRVESTRMRHDAATKIKSWYEEESRKEIERRRNKKMLIQLREFASIIVQNAWRRKAAYMRKHQIMIKKKTIESLQQIKAYILTSWWRVCLAKCHVNKLRIEKIEEERRIIRWTIWAATKIAACWRVKIGRSRAKEAFIEKQSRWKQLWSETDNRYFFYNQSTGEVRWRKPQQLLDLEEKPICSNCSISFAVVECTNCCEYFCKDCWNSGKQKKS